MAIRSDVPIGAGLRSSAAIVVAQAIRAPEHRQRERPHRLANLCRQAENELVGIAAESGPDHLVLGKEGTAMCSLSLVEYRLLPLPENVRLGIGNTMVKHELARASPILDDRVRAGVEHFAKRLPGFARSDCGEDLNAAAVAE